jgi:hypothetical protein
LSRGYALNFIGQARITSVDTVYSTYRYRSVQHLKIQKCTAPIDSEVYSTYRYRSVQILLIQKCTDTIDTKVYSTYRYRSVQHL